MAKISNPTANYEDGEFAIGKDIYADILRLYVEFNGNITAENLVSPCVSNTELATESVDSNKMAVKCILDAKMELTSANSGILVWNNGTDYAGENGGILVRIKATFTLSGSSPDTYNFFWWRDCVDGNPLFNIAPTMVGSPMAIASNENDEITAARVISLTVSGAQIELNYGNGTGEVTVEFSVAGPLKVD
jgi:hypothetical protein